MVSTRNCSEIRLTAAAWNATVAIGTAVRYWPGAREGEGKQSKTRAAAWELGDGTPVVSVEGYAGGIALTHVEVDEDRAPEASINCGTTSAEAIFSRGLAPNTICVHEKPPWECEACADRYEKRDERVPEPHEHAMAQLELAFGRKDWEACRNLARCLEQVFERLIVEEEDGERG